MMMYDAIMKAADHIEKHPWMYNYMSNDMPSRDIDTGCMAGWMLYFAGYRGKSIKEFILPVFGWRSLLVIDQMGYWADRDNFCKFPGVTFDASQAAKWMRHWAQRYRPLPASVIQIFTETASV